MTEHITRIYIAGPMTGLVDFNFPAFFAAEKALQASGFETANPARHGAGTPGASWADYMRRDIPDLLTCDAVAVLPGWGDSRGAALEVHIARSLDMPVAPLQEWLAHQTESTIPADEKRPLGWLFNKGVRADG